MRLDPAFIEEVRKLMNRADKYGLEMKDVLQQHLSNTAETEIVKMIVRLLILKSN